MVGKSVLVMGGLEHVSRSGVKQCMQHFGEVCHVHKPPACGDPVEDAAVVTFGTEASAIEAVKAMKEGRVYIDGVNVTGDFGKGRGQCHGAPKYDTGAPGGRTNRPQIDDRDNRGRTLALSGRSWEARSHERFDQTSTSLRDLLMGPGGGGGGGGGRRGRSRSGGRQLARRRSGSREARRFSEGGRSRRGGEDESHGREWVCQLTTPRPSMRDFLDEPEPPRQREKDRERRRDRSGGRGGRRRRERPREDEHSEDRCEDDGYGAPA